MGKTLPFAAVLSCALASACAGARPEAATPRAGQAMVKMGESSCAPRKVRPPALATGEMRLRVGQAITLPAADISEFSNASPEALDVRVDHPEHGSPSFLLTAKAPGRSTLLTFDKKRQRNVQVIMVVAHDADEVAKELENLLADLCGIEVVAGPNRFILQGTVHKQQDKAKVDAIVGLYGDQVASVVVFVP